MTVVIHKGVVILRTEDIDEAMDVYSKAVQQWPADEVLLCEVTLPEKELVVRKPRGGD